MHTVLVIEDDPDMREIERTALGIDGYALVMATNGWEGLEALARIRPCLILLDLMMPGMDGLTFLEERRKRQLGEGVPILCLSAASDNMVEHALRLGAHECIQKPVDFDRLFDRLGYYCPHEH